VPASIDTSASGASASFAARDTNRAAAFSYRAFVRVREDEHDRERLASWISSSAAAVVSTSTGSPERSARRNCVRVDP
jgi:hypothetical protein